MEEPGPEEHIKWNANSQSPMFTCVPMIDFNMYLPPVECLRELEELEEDGFLSLSCLSLSLSLSDDFLSLSFLSTMKI